MNKEQQALLAWHQKFNVKINERPTIVDVKTAQLRVSLIHEECEEFDDAATVGEDLVEIADALGDLLYVVYGAAVSYGIDLEPVFNEIHRSNISKLWEDGTVHYREDGKVLKPTNYSPANLARILQEQGWVE